MNTHSYDAIIYLVCQDLTLLSRQLEIRLRWEHLGKRTCAHQAGDSPEQEPQAGRVILLAQRHHSSQRGRSRQEHCPVPALGEDAAAEWPQQPAADPLASDRLAQC